MRTLKWLAGIAVIIALVAIIVHLRRDAIARSIANSVLEEQGFVATELRIASLSPGRLELEHLVIQSASGARYEVTGLSVPLKVTTGVTARLSARRLAVRYDTRRDRQEMLSTTLATVFALPDADASFAARVDSIVLPGLPAFKDASLRVENEELNLAFSLDAIAVTAALIKQNLGVTRLRAGAQQEDSVVMQVDLDFTRRDDRYRASGEISASLSPWLPTLQALELVPPGLLRLDAQLVGRMAIQLDETEAGHARVNLELAADDGTTIAYRGDSGRMTNFVASAADTVAVDFDYPANDWQLQVESAGGVFSTDGLSETPVSIVDLECQRGITCTLHAVVDAQATTFNDYTVDAATLSLPLTVSTGNNTRVQIAADARGEFQGLASAGLAAARATVTGFSGTEIVVADSWRCRIDALQLAFDDLVARNDLLVSPDVTLADLEIGDSGTTLAGKITVSAPVAGKWKDVALSLPGATGSLSFASDELWATVDLVDRSDAVAGSIIWRRNTAADTGALEIRNGWVSFDRSRLSDYLPAAKLPLEILQGNWDIDLRLQWQVTQAIPQYRGTAAMSLNSIGGRYTDIAMVGLTTDLTASIDPAEGLALQASPVSIRLIDVGVPIENIEFDYDPDIGDQSAQITGLALDVFGGNVTAEPFEYSLASGSDEIMLHASAIQLQLMVDILEFESLQMTGTISGRIPVTMADDRITVSGGQMDNDGPGTIRYRPPGGALDAVAPGGGLGAIARTLTNFEFETLSSTINYTEGGDMTLLTRVVGLNPDIDPGQPYAFNLNLENNIPQMLRSLRAVRSIEDILKQRTEN